MLKKQIVSLLCGVALLPTLTQAAPINTIEPKVTTPLEKSPQVTLLIGNSYSFYNCGVHTALRGLMKNGTPQENMKTRLLTISSGSLSFHDVAFYLQPHELDPYAKVTNGKLSHPMFDVVLLQDNSAAATSKKRIPALMKYTKQHAQTIRDAGSTPMLIMTWPKKDRPEDIQKIADNTIQAANDANIMVIPVGLAFMNAIQQRPDLTMYMPDKSHPSAAGTYLYGATLYATLFHRSPEDINYLGECEKPLTPETAAFLRKVAWDTVKDFFHW